MEKSKIFERKSIAWNNEQLHKLNIDWGKNAALTDDDRASAYFDKSLNFGVDKNVLLQRSRVQRNIMNLGAAEEDARLGLSLAPDDASINLELCNAIYYENRFEDAAYLLHDNLRKFKGRKVDAFKEKLTVVEKNFDNNLGPSCGHFLVCHQDILPDFKPPGPKDDRPLWKILKADNKCDIVSYIEKQQRLLSPLELANIKRKRVVFLQNYMKPMWKDVLFLHNLKNNQNLFLPQMPAAAGYLRNLINKSERVDKIARMLHARNPWYNKKYTNFPNKKTLEEYQRKSMTYIEVQTNRNLYAILHTIRKLRANGDTEALAQYIDKVMGDYISTKTERLICWKFEFIAEVYNTLALAYADKCTTLGMPNRNTNLRPSEQIRFLLNISPMKLYKKAKFDFFDHSSSTTADRLEQFYAKTKKIIDRLEFRMKFAKYSLEKTYLYHEIARHHLKLIHLEESISTAKKGVEAARKGKHALWEFLNFLIIMKAQVEINYVEGIDNALREMYEIAGRLKSRNLKLFVTLLLELNDNEKACRTIRRHGNSSFSLDTPKSGLTSRSASIANWQEE